MIHEVLFSLWHCPSELFKLDDKLEWINSVELATLLHPGEKKILEKILKLSAYYHRFENFRKMVNNQHTIQYEVMLKDNVPKESKIHGEFSCGFYLKSFSIGLNQVLEGYRKTILNLEYTLLENPQLTLMYVLAALEKYTTLFEYIESMICTMEAEKIYGCHLIGRLHKYTDCGIIDVCKAANIIIKAVNATFYKQLADWIIYGDLSDVYNEFFIADCKCDDENFLYPEQLEELDSNTNRMKNWKTKKPCRVKKFMIRPQMLPSMLPYEIAESILFIGRIVWIMQNDPNQNYGVLGVQFQRDIWDGKNLEYYRKIQDLEAYPFSLARFEPTIQECRIRLTKYLWKIMVDEAELLNHLQILRDYYALGRGELFQQFIVLAKDYLQKNLSDVSNKNLNSLFNETARKIYGDKDKSYQKIELFISKNTEGLEMHVDIPWPLHIVFHPEVVTLYNKLFNFLIRVRKTSIDLHILWSIHTNSKMKINSSLWTLRHNLLFLVNNIQYYLQVDVIEAHFSMLRESIQNTNEVNDIIRLHSTFLGDLLRKTFVMLMTEESIHVRQYSLYQLPSVDADNKNMVYTIIMQLLQLCDKFCYFANTCAEAEELAEPDKRVLEQFQQESETIIETLLRALFSMHEKVSGHHLLQLLHRLDFNRWFTKTKPDLNIIENKG